MKLTKGQLNRIIKEELGAALGGGAIQVVPLFDEVEVSEHTSVEDGMSSLLSCLRCAGIWFHAAHQLTKGTGFAGDHVNIYGEIYEALIEDYDGAAEKAIGITEDEGVACPQTVTAAALEKLLTYPSPAGASPAMIAGTALQIVRDLNDHVETLFGDLEAAGDLPLGLNDFLASAANDYTRYIYLLQQRVKES